jgi:hypothetical protein
MAPMALTDALGRQASSDQCFGHSAASGGGIRAEHALERKATPTKLTRPQRAALPLSQASLPRATASSVAARFPLGFHCHCAPARHHALQILARVLARAVVLQPNLRLQHACRRRHAVDFHSALRLSHARRLGLSVRSVSYRRGRLRKNYAATRKIPSAPFSSYLDRKITKRPPCHWPPPARNVPVAPPPSPVHSR